jgi:hypothetical protein
MLPGAAPADEPHWAFQPVKRPAVPRPTRNPIDAFLKAGPEASRTVLIRRVTFDLTGLPPIPEEIDAFLQDKSPQAWEKVIDRLLASPRYGEHWGRHWLDLARYADTKVRITMIQVAKGAKYDPKLLKDLLEKK